MSGTSLRRLAVQLVVALIAMVAIWQVGDQKERVAGPVVVEPYFTALPTRLESVREVTATFSGVPSGRDLLSDDVRILSARIARRPARVRVTASEVRASLHGVVTGVALGRRYGVELVYYDELSGRTERIRFSERLGPAPVTVCDPASPC